MAIPDAMSHTDTAPVLAATATAAALEEPPLPPPPPKPNETPVAYLPPTGYHTSAALAAPPTQRRLRCSGTLTATSQPSYRVPYVGPS